MPFEEYPKWVNVDGPGHPDSPGRVLVNSEDEEREATFSGKGPAALNPPPNPGQKALRDMDRDELKATLLREGVPDDMTDDDIRAAIETGRERREQYAREDAEEAKRNAEARAAGGDHGDGLQTDKVPADEGKPDVDAAGDKIAPDPTDEANKTAGNDAQRDAPQARSRPATDVRPDDAQKKVADDKPAGNVTEAAATPPSHKKGARKPD